MNDATKQALNDFVLQAVSAAQKGAEWTAEQAPLLVQEWLHWYLASAAIWAAFGLLIVLASAVSIRGAVRGFKAADDYEKDPYAAWFGIGGVLPCVFGVVTLFISILRVVKVLVAPRVVVIDQMAQWLK